MSRLKVLLTVGYACGLVVLVVGVAMTPGYRAAQKKISQERVRALDAALAQFLSDHRRCPAGRDELVTNRYVQARALEDTWGTSIAYSCSPTGVQVRSAGRDKVLDTADDLASPP